MANNLNLFSKGEMQKSSALKVKFSNEELKTLKALEKDVIEEFSKTKLSFYDMQRNGKNLVRQSSSSKAGYQKKLAESFCNPEYFFHYFNTFSDEGKKIFVKFAFDTIVSKSDIFVAIYGDKKRDYFFSRDESKLPFSFFFNYDNRFSLFFYLPDAIKKCLQIYLKEFREVVPEISDEDFKKKPNFFSEKEGLEFFVNLSMIVQVLSDSKFFEREVGASILKTTLKKLDKIVVLSQFSKEEFETFIVPIDKSKGFKIFYDEKKIEKFKLLRTNLALAFLSFTVNEMLSTEKGKKEFLLLSSDPVSLLKSLMKAFETAKSPVFDKKFLYPHLTFAWFNDLTYIRERIKNMGKLISVIGKNLPVKPMDFLEYMNLLLDSGAPQFIEKDADAFITFCASDGYGYDDYGNKYKVPIYYDKASRTEFVFKEACTNLFLTFAAIGLFEISWLPPCDKFEKPEEVVNWYNSLEFYRFGRIGTIKVTPLGAYIFGATKDFSASGIKSFAPPKLDSESLTIHIDDGDKSMQVFLSSFCIQLSHTLYKADELLLKKYCSSKEDVKEIFETLAARSKNSLPVIWLQLKSRVQESFVTLQAEVNWCVFPLENMSGPIIKEIEKN